MYAVSFFRDLESSFRISGQQNNVPNFHWYCIHEQVHLHDRCCPITPKTVNAQYIGFLPTPPISVQL